ncbi:putative caffeoyl-CoA O-methyltransferase 1 [Dermacentor variabilis]|uniref:putative caffeoyl-CoA O-methyltransferase 1 n=1 Tax=Dermacentor variabilis TaxID=34621 RepID=UPI003F5BE17E
MLTRTWRTVSLSPHLPQVGGSFSDSHGLPPKKSLVCPKAAKYAEDHTLRLHPAQKKLMEITKSHVLGAMLGDSCQLQFFQILLKTMSAKKYLEIGTFTGCSAVAAALALPPDGKVVALDQYECLVNPGRPYWKEAGVEDKIELRIGPAVDSLDALLREGQAGTFDFIFIDAEKENYDNYYEKSLQLVRKNGLIAIDNVLWRGQVYDTDNNSLEATALRLLNKKLHEDQRIDVCLLPVADGLTFARKR